MRASVSDVVDVEVVEDEAGVRVKVRPSRAVLKPSACPSLLPPGLTEKFKPIASKSFLGLGCPSDWVPLAPFTFVDLRAIELAREFGLTITGQRRANGEWILMAKLSKAGSVHVSGGCSPMPAGRGVGADSHTDERLYVADEDVKPRDADRDGRGSVVHGRFAHVGPPTNRQGD